MGPSTTSMQIPPLLPTSRFLVYENPPGKASIFFLRKIGPNLKNAPFFSQILHYKTSVLLYSQHFSENKIPPPAPLLAPVRGLSSFFPPYPVEIPAFSKIELAICTNFLMLYVNLSIIPRAKMPLFHAPQGFQPSSPSFFCSSFWRCSCIFALDAARKRMRDCFTSSSAAWTASSVRARASSA